MKEEVRGKSGEQRRRATRTKTTRGTAGEETRGVEPSWTGQSSEAASNSRRPSRAHREPETTSDGGKPKATSEPTGAGGETCMEDAEDQARTPETAEEPTEEGEGTKTNTIPNVIPLMR